MIRSRVIMVWSGQVVGSDRCRDRPTLCSTTSRPVRPPARFYIRPFRFRAGLGQGRVWLGMAEIRARSGRIHLWLAGFRCETAPGCFVRERSLVWMCQPLSLGLKANPPTDRAGIDSCSTLSPGLNGELDKSLSGFVSSGLSGPVVRATGRTD